MSFCQLLVMSVLILLLVPTNQTTIVTAADICICTELRSQSDCLLNSDCEWSESCQKKQNITIVPAEPYSQLCGSLLTPKSMCPVTYGCAYLNSKCIQFSGCTSYVFTTHAECQSVTNQCTTDGVQCIEPRACVLNQNEELCQTVISSTGSKKCVWTGTVCRDQYCTEAPLGNTTDKDCNSFLPGCVTTGRGCIDKRMNCYSYGTDCIGKVGSDGVCEYKDKLCQPKDCSEADSTHDTDEKCQLYRKGCRSFGLGCTEKTLKACNTYKGTSDVCLLYIGKDGKCEVGSEGFCQARKCENAPKSYKTNLECQSYSAICVTTGQGCVSKLPLCSTYEGTNAECLLRIGADGKCKGQYDGISFPCKARVCTDVNYVTDKDCIDYQHGCLTNGIGCVYRLQPCTSYQGDSDTCNRYIGLDGKCGVGINGNCALRTCDAGQFTSTALCKNVQSNCLSDGSKCVKQTTCTATLKQPTCQDTGNCQWIGQCVANKCSSFNTLGLCTQHASTVDCYWTGNVCADKQCKHASLTIITDIDCEYFHADCVTNGKGCIEKSAPCESYIGLIDTCQLFKGVNGTVQCTYDSITSKCRALRCNDNNVATSSDQCNTFLQGCTFNGIKGCLDKSADCSQYYGDSTICYSLNPKCNQYISITDTCRPNLCEDNTTAVTDYDCDLFMSGCVTKGLGCISNKEPCTSYPGYSISDCEVFKGNGVQCWYDQDYNGQCVDKRCDHNTTATLDLDCQLFLDGCVTTGLGCQSTTLACDTYSGDEDTCGYFKGNGKRCGKISSCTDRQCSDVQNATIMNDCTSYLSTCIYDGKQGCIERAKCNAYQGFSADECKQLVNLNNDYCWQNITDYLWCGDRNCADASEIKSQEDCNSFRSGCVFNGTDKCVEKSNCSQYQFTNEACIQAVDKNNNQCWYSETNCRDRTCDDLISSVYSQEVCQQFRATCIYTGIKCAEKQTTCPQYELSQDECKFINCWKENDDDSPCTDKTCDDTVSSPSDESCRLHLETCRFNGINCVQNQATCKNYTGFTATACQEVTTTSGVYCWSTTSAVCTDRTCTDSLPMYSPDLCMKHISSCRYNGIKCQDGKAKCSDYTGFTKDACQQVTTITGTTCWNQGDSSICANSACEDLIPNASAITCMQHNNQCRFNGYRCIMAQGNCEQYDVLSASLCQQLTNSSGSACWSDISNTKCVTKSCDNRMTTYSTSICESYIQNLVSGNYIPICSYNGQKCVTMMNDCTNYHDFSGIQCQQVRSRTSLCYLETNIKLGTCRKRKCVDNTTASSNMECADFLTGCVTTGKGCIEATASCTAYIGTISSCANYVGNGIKCRGNNSAGQCSTRQCYHNTEFTSTEQCENFLPGCVTNGKGCIAATEPCSSYVGNLLQCQQFTGNGILCWSDSDQVTACRDRVCSDNKTSITDDQCEQFLPGCVSKGFGCIEKSQPCSSYTGIQAMCKRFKGNNGQTLCWNVSDATSTTKCIKRQCSHIPRGTNDTECGNFLPGCVSDGFKCVIATTCSQFYGTNHTCSQFNATDKPCTGIDNIVQPCRKLLCSDAPNNYQTDVQCEEFKTGCKTTGFGCTDNNACSGIKTQGVCGQRSDCQFVNGCIDTIKCSGLLTYSQCVNYGCGWNYNRQSCRNWQCSDASVLLTQHLQCQKLNESCTTSGFGCIEISYCVQYNNKDTCVNAKSLDYSSRCIWDIDHCRAFICEDAPQSLSTDDECKIVHPLCVAAGYGCTHYQYQCQNFNSVGKCVADYLNKPCLWINNKNCVQFGQCTDIHFVTHDECQKYSKFCTSDGVRCIPFSKCSDYPNSESCNVGTDGTCGWVIGYDDQMQRCQIFNACSDIQGITMEDCQYYGECISDGHKCIEKNKCSNYQTKVSCSYNGTDGTCFWDGSVCRLQVCGDAPIKDSMTHQYCNSLPATSKCTTNGVICIVMQNCSNYLQSSCFVGLDGDCIYALPLGQTAGTKTCRVKDCADYSENNTTACQKHKSTCVSNGAKCIPKANCSTYKTQVACESDGLDGVCIYENGTCSLLESCLQAKSNEVACNKKSKGCQFIVEVNDGVETTNCRAVTCGDNSICKPIYDFTETKITICISQKEGQCVEGNATFLAQSRCYAYSYNTYTWNSLTNSCEKCQRSTINNTKNDTTSNGHLLIFSFLMLLL